MHAPQTREYFIYRFLPNHLFQSVVDIRFFFSFKSHTKQNENRRESGNACLFYNAACRGVDAPRFLACKPTMTMTSMIISMIFGIQIVCIFGEIYLRITHIKANAVFICILTKTQTKIFYLFSNRKIKFFSFW